MFPELVTHGCLPNRTDSLFYSLGMHALMFMLKIEPYLHALQTLSEICQ